MPLSPLHTSNPALKLPVWKACFVIAALASASAAPKSAPAKPNAQTAPTIPTIPMSELDRNASRFILPEKRQEYVEKMLARLSMSNRQFDPFGRPQDPDAKIEIAPTPDDSNKGPKTPQKASLQDVVNLLKITTIMPREKRFLIDFESYQVGDTIPLVHRSKPFKAQVTSVSASQIEFRDLGSSQTATLKINMVPAGWLPGGMAIDTPGGMTRKSSNAPIVVDAPTLPSSR